MSKREFFVLFGLFFLLWLANACTQTMSDDHDQLERDELEFNHFLLQNIYLYSDEIGALRQYEGKGTASSNYRDVIYLYASLSDPFTRYFDPDNMQSALDSYLGGEEEAMVGVVYGILGNDGDAADTLVVHRIIPASPAEKAGVQVGDRILKVNGESVIGSGANQAGSLMEGGAGTLVTMELLREGKTVSVQLKKAFVAVPTVWLDYVDSIPVIQVTWFAENSLDSGGTADEFEKILTKAGDFEAAVIDLRNNPGGSVDQCMKMTDDLLSQGPFIWALEHSIDKKTYVGVVDTIELWEPGESTSWEGRYYVFLADGGSASCSELMLASVRGNSDYLIVGDTTYGKGIAQILLQTYAKGLAVVSSSEFRMKDWTNYHKVGLAPDLKISDADSALAAAVRIAKQKGLTAGLQRRNFEPIPIPQGLTTLKQKRAVEREPMMWLRSTH